MKLRKTPIHVNDGKKIFIVLNLKLNLNLTSLDKCIMKTTIILVFS